MKVGRGHTRSTKLKECSLTSQTIVETILGINLNTLDDFIEALEKEFRLSQGDVAGFRELKNRGAHNKLIHEINYAGDFAMKYGYIVMNRNDDKFDCAVVLYTINFKLKPKLVKGWFSNSYEQVSLTFGDLEAIKSNYLPMKALESFRNEGLIQGITYEGN